MGEEPKKIQQDTMIDIWNERQSIDFVLNKADSNSFLSTETTIDPYFSSIGMHKLDKLHSVIWKGLDAAFYDARKVFHKVDGLNEALDRARFARDRVCFISAEQTYTTRGRIQTRWKVIT